MDVRLTNEQQQLRDAAAKLADDLGPGSVQDLDDATRVARLEKTVAAAGWRELRSDGAPASRWPSLPKNSAEDSWMFRSSGRSSPTTCDGISPTTNRPGASPSVPTRSTRRDSLAHS